MSIDSTQLAQGIVTYLMPALPYLWKGIKLTGQEITKSVGEEIGKKIPKTAILLWNKIWDKAEKDPIAPIIIERAAEKPSDESSQKALEQQLQILFLDESFRITIYELFEKAKKEQPVLNIIMNVNDLHGEVLGLDVKDADELRKAGIEIIEIEQNVKDVGKGAKLTGASFGKL